MENVRIGIIGLGNIGQVHVGNIMDGKVPRGVLTAVGDAARLAGRRGRTARTLAWAAFCTIVYFQTLFWAGLRNRRVSFGKFINTQLTKSKTVCF